MLTSFSSNTPDLRGVLLYNLHIMLPEWFYIGVAALFGLIIGSFLNVVIYRFHTGRSLNDRSHCLSCGKSLHWYELFPVFSYVVLRGRCSLCGSFIPYRYALVELLTAGAFVLAYLKAGDWLELGLLLVLLSLLLVGLVYDLYHMIIPDEVSYGAAALAVAIIGWQTYLTSDWRVLINALLGGAIAFLIFGGLWYFSKGKSFGFGDAKLVISLGTLIGLTQIFSFMAFSFWIGAIISLLIIGFQQFIFNKTSVFGSWRRVNIKSEVPFAPFMVASFVLVYFFNVDILIFIENIMRWIG